MDDELQLESGSEAPKQVRIWGCAKSQKKNRLSLECYITCWGRWWGIDFVYGYNSSRDLRQDIGISIQCAVFFWWYFNFCHKSKRAAPFQFIPHICQSTGSPLSPPRRLQKSSMVLASQLAWVRKRKLVAVRYSNGTISNSNIHPAGLVWVPILFHLLCL